MPAVSLFDEEPLSVSELTAQLKELVEESFPSIWVAGEVTNFTKASSGHWYFTLKDETAQIRAVMFRGFNLRIRFDPRDGLDVLARGRLTIYERRGDYQLQVEELQPQGIGAAELALRQLKEKLLARGYFHPERKRGLPRFPRRVGLIASVSGAAIRDMIELFAQRWPLTELVVHHSRVQGDGAAEEIAAAIELLNRLHQAGELPLDAIILGRGGGSVEDLWAFNEECVATAVFNSIVPIVSAVGHEVDVTIADLVADHRAETPSAAVVALTPHLRELSEGLQELGNRFHDAIRRRLMISRQRLDQLASRPALHRPLQRIREHEQRLDDLGGRLRRAMNQRLVQSSDKVAALTLRLETLSPLNVLTRGYSLTHKLSGALIRAASEVQPGDRLVTRVAMGEILSCVESDSRKAEMPSNSIDDPRASDKRL